MDDLVVSRALVIPDAELVERFSRSSGPGGQGVNTTDSRVELSLDLAASPSVPNHLRERMLERLAPRLVDGVLTVVAQEHRTQLREPPGGARSGWLLLLSEASAPLPPQAQAHPPLARREGAAARGEATPGRDQAGAAGAVRLMGRWWDGPVLGRRGLLLGRPGCAGRPGRVRDRAEGDGVGEPERFTYGDDPSQWADLYRPDGDPRGVVVVIHGGFWKAAYDAALGAPLATDLAGAGWAAWNLEYRRVGNGGGCPATLDDVAAGIDRLADVAGLDLSTVVALGHSAGGHLATWAAGRTGPTPGDRCVCRSPRSSRRPASSTSAPPCARASGPAPCEAFLGRPWSELDGRGRTDVDPLPQVPLDVPVWCVHGARATPIVPIAQSEAYVAAATAAGARPSWCAVAGDHFVVIDVGSDAWARIVEILDGL